MAKSTPLGERLVTRLGDEDKRLAAALCDHYGLTESGLVRLLLRADARRLGYLGQPEPLDAPAPARRGKGER